MNFQEWMNEKERYDTRLERIYRETIVDPPNDAVDHWKVIEKWLKTAYICGKIDGINVTETVKELPQDRLFV